MKMVDASTGTITVDSLSAVAKQHDMSRHTDAISQFIKLFTSSATSDMNKEDFIELFQKCDITLDTNGQIVT